MKQRWLYPAIVFFPCLLILVIHSLYYTPFIADDALISLRYAQRFIAGEGLTWTEGLRVEGYSNLLWILLCSLLGRLGVDLIVASRILGLIGMSSCFLAILWAYRPSSLKNTLPALAGSLSLVLSGSFAVWAVGGLEQPLLAGLLGWIFTSFYTVLEKDALTWKEIRLPGLLLACLTLTRPDGILFTVSLSLAFFVVRGFKIQTIKMVVCLSCLPLLFFLGQTVFRLLYYGAWVPNTALVKLTFTEKRFFEGWSYIKDSMVSFLPLLILALPGGIATFLNPPTRKRTLLLLIPILVWLSYVIIIGGDIFPARRHLIPALVSLAFLISEGIKWLLRQKSIVSLTTWILTPLLLSLFLIVQLKDPQNQRAKEERWEWDGAVIGNFLKKAFGNKHPLLAVDPAGCVPYFSELPSIDMLGLNDYYLPRHPPPNFGQGPLAHELGDGNYILNRHPDLVLFCIPAGSEKACFRSGHEMQQNPLFLNHYKLVTFEGQDPYLLQSQVWVRQESHKIGIQKTESHLVIPAFLTHSNSNSASVTFLDPQGRLGTRFQQFPIHLSDIVLPPGDWQLLIDSSEINPTVTLSVSQSTTPLASGEQTIAFVLEGKEPSSLEITITPKSPNTFYLRQIEFVRLDPRQLAQ